MRRREHLIRSERPADLDLQMRALLSDQASVADFSGVHAEAATVTCGKGPAAMIAQPCRGTATGGEKQPSGRG